MKVPLRRRRNNHRTRENMIKMKRILLKEIHQRIQRKNQRRNGNYAQSYGDY